MQHLLQWFLRPIFSGDGQLYFQVISRCKKIKIKFILGNQNYNIMQLFTKLLQLLVLTILFQQSTAQVLNFKKKERFKEESTNQLYYKTVVVSGLTSRISPLKLRIINTELGATLNRDYQFVETSSIGTHTLTETDSIISIPIMINADAFVEPDEQFVLTYAYDSANIPKVFYDTITITDPASAPPALPDTSKWSVRIVTGSNFDFFDAPTFKNFAGDLNIFLPNLFKPICKKSEKRIGLNIGVFNYRYYDADSSGSNIVNENYLLDPTVRRIAIDTTKYVRDIYYLNSKTSYNNWGIYLNPMIPISSDKWYDLFLELHLEAIWKTKILSYSQQSIRKDTFVITQADMATHGVFQNFKGIRSLYEKNTYFDYYLGIGTPVKIDIKKAFELFLQPSVGAASYRKTEVNVSESLSIRSRSFVETMSWNPYFLTKFQLITTVTPVDIVLGGEYRKIFNQQAFFGMYLGASISLDKLKK